MASIDVLVLHCDGDDESTDILDSSQYENSPVAFGSAKIDADGGVFSGAIRLSQDGSRIAIPDSSLFHFSGDFTIQLRAKFNTLPTSSSPGCPLAKCYNDNTSSSFLFEMTDSSLRFYNHTLSNSAGGSYSFSTGVYYEFCVMRKDGVIYLMIDGVPVGGSLSFSGEMGNNSDDLTIGSRYINNQGGWNARDLDAWIDEVRITKRARYSITGYIPESGPFYDRRVSAAARSDARATTHSQAAPRADALRNFAYASASARSDSRAKATATGGARSDARSRLSTILSIPRSDALRNFLYVQAVARADARARTFMRSASRADARARTFAESFIRADARVPAFSAAAPSSDALELSGADFYRRDPSTGAEMFLGFVPGDFSAPLALSGVSLAVGSHDIVVRPRSWFWRDCRSAASLRLTIAAGGGGVVTVQTLPEIATLTSEARYGETLISWDVLAPLGAIADGFRLWFSPTSPVPTTGTPIATVTYLDGLASYLYSRAQVADEYVAIKVYDGSTLSEATELHLVMDAALASPDGQHAANF